MDRNKGSEVLPDHMENVLLNRHKKVCDRSLSQGLTRPLTAKTRLIAEPGLAAEFRSSSLQNLTFNEVEMAVNTSLPKS